MRDLFAKTAAGLILVFALAVAAPRAFAETHTENVVAEQRTYVFLQVAANAAQAFLRPAEKRPNLTVLTDRTVDRELQNRLGQFVGDGGDTDKGTATVPLESDDHVDDAPNGRPCPAFTKGCDRSA